LQCLSDELCEMMFLVPLVNGEKLDYTWRKLPEKHLFHDFMYVIKRVAMATPIGTMTRWTDENFIKVFFFEYCQICTKNSPPEDTDPSAAADPSSGVRALVWITQPSRQSRFLGIARPVRHPGFQSTNSGFPLLLSRPIQLSINWFLKGKRLRGRGNNGRRVMQQDDTNAVEDHDDQNWLGQWGVVNSLERRNDVTAGMEASVSADNEGINNVRNIGGNVPNDDALDDSFGVHVDDDDDNNVDSSNVDQLNEERTASARISSVGHASRESTVAIGNPTIRNNTSGHSSVRITSQSHVQRRFAPNVSRPTRGNTAESRLARAGGLVGMEPSAEDRSMEVARNIGSIRNFELRLSRPNWVNLDTIEVPPWCPFFQKAMKKNYFARMMHPLGWMDGGGKPRSALDVLFVRIILSEMFLQIYKTKRSFTDVKNEMDTVKSMDKFAKFPFSVLSGQEVVSLESLFENFTTFRDKIISILGWLKFGNENLTFTCVQDIIGAEEKANQCIVASALKSMDRNVINDALFYNTSSVSECNFMSAITPIPALNPNSSNCAEMLQIDTDICDNINRDPLLSWALAKNALAEGKISYVVTRRIWVEYIIYAYNRNNYLRGCQNCSEQDGSTLIRDFEQYLEERGCPKKKSSSKMAGKRKRY